MNNMPSKKSIISLALGSALAAALGTASIASAAENPFAMQSLDKGYMVAASDDYGDKKDEYGDKTDGYGDKKRGEGRCGMAMADTNNDGRVSQEEHANHCQLMFDKMDTNKDGYIDKDEASAMRKKHGHHSRKSGDKYGSSGSSGSGYNYGSGMDWTNPNLEHMKTMGE
ncbi:EF-hand domain-containing protein [Nitrosospira briensis]|uniref:EF-hand domain-containing protein n=1 Tax=Nitrosospira briensis TaxID=35799 RepID=UPI001E37D348|nr:EF-hand domain-containing protein [Nitrosospira briensis]